MTVEVSQEPPRARLFPRSHLQFPTLFPTLLPTLFLTLFLTLFRMEPPRQRHLASTVQVD